MNKINLTIMKHPPEIADEEILRYMDFDNVLNLHTAVIRNAKKYAILKKGVLLVGGIALISAVWFYRPVGQDTTIPPGELPREFHSKGSLPDPQFSESQVPAHDNDSDHAVASDQPLPQAKSGKKVVNPDESTGMDQETSSSENVYQQAEPVDGYTELYKYFNTALRYPQQTLADSVQGVVTVHFTIDARGKPGNITIENSLGKEFDNEAVRLLEHMPAWKPAMLNGNPVPSKLSLPVTFQIKSVK